MGARGEEASRAAAPGADAWPLERAARRRALGSRRGPGKTSSDGVHAVDAVGAAVSPARASSEAENNTVVRKVVTGLGGSHANRADVRRRAGAPSIGAPVDEAGTPSGPVEEPPRRSSGSPLLREGERAACSAGTTPRTLRRAAASADDEERRIRRRIATKDPRASSCGGDAGVSESARRRFSRVPRLGRPSARRWMSVDWKCARDVGRQGPLARAAAGQQTRDDFFGKYRESGARTRVAAVRWRPNSSMRMHSGWPSRRRGRRRRRVRRAARARPTRRCRRWSTPTRRATTPGSAQWQQLLGSGAAVRVEGSAPPRRQARSKVAARASRGASQRRTTFARVRRGAAVRSRVALIGWTVLVRHGRARRRGFVLGAHREVDADARVLAMTVDDFEATLEALVPPTPWRRGGGGGAGGGDDDDMRSSSTRP